MLVCIKAAWKVYKIKIHGTALVDMEWSSGVLTHVPSIPVGDFLLSVV